MNWISSLRSIFPALVGGTLAAHLLVPVAAAQCQTDALVPAVQSGGELFGNSVAVDPLDSAFLMVGATSANAVGGRVTVFTAQAGPELEYAESQTLVPMDNAVGDVFGFAIAMTTVGGVRQALISSPRDDDNGMLDSGSVYVWKFAPALGWRQVGKLHASDPSINAWFGRDIQIDGSRAIIGASAPTQTTEIGGAYIFEHDGTNWVEVQKLAAAGVAAGDTYGFSVAVQGDFAAVGSPLHDEEAGAVYVWARDSTGTWVEHTKIELAPPAPGPDPTGDGAFEFGNDVDFDDDHLFIGAWHGDGDDFPLITFEGAAYVYERDDNMTPSDPFDDVFTQAAHLWAADAEQGGHFGTTVEGKGNLLIVGAYIHDDHGGEVYVFEKDTTGTEDAGDWHQHARLTPSSNVADDEFGYATALTHDGEFLLVGARGTAQNGPDTGTVYQWSLHECELGAESFDIEALTGGVQDFHLDAGAAYAGDFYWILGSASGTSPGFQGLPLNFDGYFNLTLQFPGLLIAGQVGVLDGSGHADASFFLPPVPTLAGVQLFHAYVAFDVPSFAVSLISNPVHVLLQ